jgi:hypothetical protein
LSARSPYLPPHFSDALKACEYIISHQKPWNDLTSTFAEHPWDGFEPFFVNRDRFGFVPKGNFKKFISKLYSPTCGPQGMDVCTEEESKSMYGSMTGENMKKKVQETTAEEEDDTIDLDEEDDGGGEADKQQKELKMKEEKDRKKLQAAADRANRSAILLTYVKKCYKSFKLGRKKHDWKRPRKRRKQRLRNL